MQHEVLRKALSLVLDHKSELDNELFAGTHYRVLNVRKSDDSKENMRKWFMLVLGPGWRGGGPPRLEKRREALQAFDRWYDNVFSRIRGESPSQRVVDEMYRTLDNIPSIGPKIAGVLLRDWIYHFQIWPELKNYLYLPIDRHVRNIIVNKLEAGDEAEVPNVGDDYFKDRNRKFQEELDIIHRPRVEFDYLWVIGSKFCSYHLCHVCWLNVKELCKYKEPLV